MIKPRQWVTVTEAADMLQVCRRTVYNRMKRLPPCYVHRVEHGDYLIYYPAIRALHVPRGNPHLSEPGYTAAMLFKAAIAKERKAAAKEETKKE